jgi:hypothetical protein
VSEVPGEVASSLGLTKNEFITLHHLLTDVIANLDRLATPARP